MSTQVTPVLHDAHSELVTVVPVDCASHHWPVEATRPARSALPSPLKSPTRTSTQGTEALQVVQRLNWNVEPLERPTHTSPLSAARATMSVLPSPLKSPMSTSAQVTPVDMLAHKLLLKPVAPLETAPHTWPLDDTRPNNAGGSVPLLTVIVAWPVNA